MVKVLISGAGIAGLSLALRLKQRGLTPVVVERSPRLRDGGYMLGLADPGLDAAERMGVADALRAARRSNGWWAIGGSTSCAVTSNACYTSESATRWRSALARPWRR